MKKMQTVLFITAIISVFTLSFLIGRAAALSKSANKNGEGAAIYTGTVPIPEKKEEEEESAASAKAFVKKEAKSGVQEDLNENEPPSKMEFPVGEDILKQYSEEPIYSETLKKQIVHSGIDYSAKIGEDVKATWNGIVTRVYKDKLWGYVIEINHGGNLCSVYKNLAKKIEVHVGEEVEAGQIIGKVGKTAQAEEKDKPHLHFELTQDGVCINPESYIYAAEDPVWETETESVFHSEPPALKYIWQSGNFF